MNFDDPDMKMRKAHFLRPIGRLKPGVSLAQAQADTDMIAAHLEQQYPESNTGWNLRLVSLREQLVGGTRTTLFVLFGAVGFVLLLACANGEREYRRERIAVHASYLTRNRTPLWSRARVPHCQRQPYRLIKRRRARF